jgi:hypothetical protein
MPHKLVKHRDLTLPNRLLHRNLKLPLTRSKLLVTSKVKLSLKVVLVSNSNQCKLAHKNMVVNKFKV